jgi:hypothetical protein
MAHRIRFAAPSAARLTWLHKRRKATRARGPLMFGDRLWLAFRAPKVLPGLWAFCYPITGRKWPLARRIALRLYMRLLALDLALWRLRRA